jgi:hypothetical protein
MQADGAALLCFNHRYLGYTFQYRVTAGWPWLPVRAAESEAAQWTMDGTLGSAEARKLPWLQRSALQWMACGHSGWRPRIPR